MTQGDFLGSEDVKPDFYYNKGVSLLLIYTPKGKIFLKTLKKNFDLLISNASECTKKQPRVSFATEESPSRNEFWNDYNRRGFKYIGRSQKPHILISILLFSQFSDAKNTIA